MQPPFSETSEQLSHPIDAADVYPCVAFGIEFAEIAQQTGKIIDVDGPLLHASLALGGLSSSQITECPVVIKVSNNPTEHGAFVYEHPENDGKPAIELFTFRGVEPITAKAVTHEAKHVSDYLNVGSDVFVSAAAKRKRKIGVAAASLAAGAVCYKTGYLPHFRFAHADDPEFLPLTFLQTDIILNTGLMMEYSVRIQERRARAAARQSTKANILHSAQPPNRLKSSILLAAASLKSLLIPNIKM